MLSSQQEGPAQHEDSNPIANLESVGDFAREIFAYQSGCKGNRNVIQIMQTSSLKRAHALRRANDMNGAFVAYKESATQDDDANAHAWLSTCYLMGYGTDRNPQKAFEHASRSAATSNPLGKNNLGYCLQHGIGTDPDPKVAFRMFQESAATGNPLAFNNLGLCLSNGTGCTADAGAAAEYFKKSAAIGDSFGINSLGNAYYSGQGVPVDYAEAFKLFTAASGKGNPTATFNLACCYLTGNGIEADTEAAFRLFETAAAGGVPAAQYRMGCMCRDGLGCPVDVERARSYFHDAAEQGHSKAQLALNRLDSSSFSAPGTPRSDIVTSDGGVLRASLLESPSFQKLFKSEEILRSVQVIHQRFQQKIAEATDEFQREIRDLENRFSLAAGIAPDVASAKLHSIQNVDPRVVDSAQQAADSQTATAARLPGRRSRPI
jgi:TPR repeat protein